MPTVKTKFRARAQSAMEYLTTYGWVILIIAIVLATLFELDVFNGGNTASACTALPGYICTNPVYGTNGISFTLGQNTGQYYYDANVFIAAEGSGTDPRGLPLNFTPSNSYSIGTLVPGATVQVPFTNLAAAGIRANAPVGTPFYGYVWLSYCTSQSCTAPTNYAKVATISAKDSGASGFSGFGGRGSISIATLYSSAVYKGVSSSWLVFATRYTLPSVPNSNTPEIFTLNFSPSASYPSGISWLANYTSDNNTAFFPGSGNGVLPIAYLGQTGGYNEYIVNLDGWSPSPSDLSQFVLNLRGSNSSCIGSWFGITSGPCDSSNPTTDAVGTNSIIYGNGDYILLQEISSTYQSSGGTVMLIDPQTGAPLPPVLNVVPGYVPITLDQGGASFAYAFQQSISFDPSSYIANEEPDLGNIRFYAGMPSTANALVSWCQSGCTNSSSNAEFWVRMPNGETPGEVINMYFEPKGANQEYDGVYAGEAPQLSSTYAQYDNGADVFTFYDNFEGQGNAAPSGFFSSNFIVSISNGLVLTVNGAGSMFTTDTPYGVGTTFDAYVPYSTDSDVFNIGYQESVSYSGGPDYGTFIRQACGATYPDQANMSAGEQNVCGSAGGMLSNSEDVVGNYSVSIDNTTESYQALNNVAMLFQPENKGFPPYPTPVGFTGGYSGPSLAVQWVRVRSNPPLVGGVPSMPSAILGNFQQT